MPEHPTAPIHAATAGQETDCWNRIGIRGDRSCPKLVEHAHCRNCGVYRSAAERLLDRPLLAEALREATEYFAQPKLAAQPRTESVVIFRLGREWLALPTRIVVQVAAIRPIHSLPHRRGGAVLGLANIRGEAIVCVSLPRLLGVAAAPGAGAKTTGGRFLVVVHRDGRVAFPVDEVHGVHRFHPSESKEPPGAVARASAAHTRATIAWDDRSVGCLDEERVMQNVSRHLA